MKKRLLILLMCALLAVSLSGCAGKTPLTSDGKEPEPIPTIKPLETLPPVSGDISATLDSITWQKAYVDYLNALAEEDDIYDLNMENFALIDIDGDGIPELYDDHGTTATGAEIFTYSSGSMESLYMYTYGLHYIQGENLLRDAGGHMDEYYDEIYRIENGKFVSVASGNYGAEDNANLQFDENGMPVYKYYWNGAEVSGEAEYQEKLNSLYNTEKETDPYKEELMYDYNEIFDVIENYIG